jgi:hypothetical protein
LQRTVFCDARPSIQSRHYNLSCDFDLWKCGSCGGDVELLPQPKIFDNLLQWVDTECEEWDSCPGEVFE